MTKFKVGDKVKVKDGRYTGYPSSSRYNIPRDIGVVNSCGEGYICVEYEIGYVHRITPPLNPGSFELIETHFPLYSEEAAVKLLTERGYEVKAPPEPLSGKVYVYQWRDGKKTIWAGTNEVEHLNCELIAIVDWTEGQGL